MPQENVQFADKTRTRLGKPKRCAVVFLNDDFTTMEFVVHVLMTVFFKTPSEAETIMMAVHRQGRGVAGIYPADIAYSKANKVTALARQEGAPLRVTVEEG